MSLSVVLPRVILVSQRRKPTQIFAGNFIRHIFQFKLLYSVYSSKTRTNLKGFCSCQRPYCNYLCRFLSPYKPAELTKWLKIFLSIMLIWHVLIWVVSKRIAIIVIDNILQFSSLLQFFDFSLKLLVYLPNEISPNYKFQTMVASPVLYFKVFGLIIQEWI